MNTEEIDEIVSRRLKEGWEWIPILYAKMLHPPKGDPRTYWAAEWVHWKDNQFYPHWINREP